eukprot:10207725-Heterocapsa_arctica.AAC.1
MEYHPAHLHPGGPPPPRSILCAIFDQLCNHVAPGWPYFHASLRVSMGRPRSHVCPRLRLHAAPDCRRDYILA